MWNQIFNNDMCYANFSMYPTVASNARGIIARHSVITHFNNTPPESPCILFCGRVFGCGLRHIITYISNFYDLSFFLFSVDQQGNWETSRNRIF